MPTIETTGRGATGSGGELRLLVDADGCPVRELCCRLAREHGIPLIFFCREHTGIRDDYARVVAVAAGPDAADHALARESRPGDIVVSRDFGLAALVIDTVRAVLDFQGRPYHPWTIDGLLLLRHAGKKARRAGHKTSGPRARQPGDDEAFVQSLRSLLDNPPRLPSPAQS